MKKTIIQILVNILFKCASKIMPENRSDWIKAMKVETEYLSSDVQALIWALACVKTATTERVKIMKTGTLRVSRFVLSLEVLCCFIPVSIVLTDLIYTAFKLQFSYENEIIFVYTAIVFCLIGPVGIILGLKFLLQKSFNIGKRLKPLLSILAIGIVLISFWFIQITSGNVSLVDSWMVFILIALMPAMAIFHMIYLSQGKSNLAQQ